MTDDLLRIRTDERRRDKVQHDLDEVVRERDRVERRMELIAADIEKEGRDVRRLEGMSLSALFVRLFGDLDRELDKEQRELFAAQARYDEQARRLTTLDAEARELESALDAIGDVAARRAAWLEERETAIRTSASASTEALDALDARRADLTADLAEVRNALEAGHRAMQSVDRAVDELDTARRWGHVDMLGGGAITSAIKHARLDTAYLSLNSAERNLQRFSQELGTLLQRGSVTAGAVRGSLRIADLVFDNPILDWIVQSKITLSLESVRDMRHRVREAVHDLERRQESLVEDLAALDTERSTVLESDA